MTHVNRKALNKNMDTGNIGLDHISNMRHEFFHSMDYDWWDKVRPGDVVVDVGACIGMFTAHALDLGASKVYSIEPNRSLLRTAMKNVDDYVINAKQSPVVPVHAAIMNNKEHINHIYQPQDAEDFQKLTFKEFIEYYEIEHIDFLKIDCEGGEYDILTKENLEWIQKNVSFIALEIHRAHSDTGAEDFMKFRNEFFKPYWDEGKVRFQNHHIKQSIWNDDLIINKQYGNPLPREFMIYFANRPSAHG